MAKCVDKIQNVVVAMNIRLSLPELFSFVVLYPQRSSNRFLRSGVTLLLRGATCKRQIANLTLMAYKIRLHCRVYICPYKVIENVIREDVVSDGNSHFKRKLVLDLRMSFERSTALEEDKVIFIVSINNFRTPGGAVG